MPDSDSLQALRPRLADARPWLAFPRDKQPEHPVPAPLQAFDQDLDSGLLEALGTPARNLDLVPEEIVLAAFLVLLSRHTGEQDLAIAWREASDPAAPRLRPIRLVLEATTPLRQFLAALREQVRTARPATLPEVAALLPPSARHPQHPGVLFPVAFAVGAPDPEVGQHLLDLNLLPPATGTAPRRIRFSYDPQYVQPDALRWLARHLLHLLRSLPAQADPPLLQLDLADPEERRTLLAWARRQPATDQPDFPQQRLEDLARERPNDVAVVDGPVSWSFAELDRRANRFAHHLRERGARPGDVAAILLPRSHVLIAAVLGTLRSGVVPLLVEPQCPAPRLATILSTSRARFVFARRPSLRSGSSPEAPPLSWMDPTLPDAPWLAAPDSPFPHAPSPSDPAQLVLTSGSTGTPKLVLAEFGYLRAAPQVGASDRVVLKSDSGTAFTWAELVAVTYGARLHVVPDGLDRDLPALAAFLREHRVTRLTVPPSALGLLLELDAFTDGSPLRVVFAIGEPLSAAVQQRFLQRLPRVRLIVGYGTTEARGCLARDVSPEDDPGLVHVGRPTPGMEVHILDPLGRHCPVGVPGELHAGGRIAREYFGNPEATRAQFVPNPFSSSPQARLFATRDQARYLPDGTVQILGRLDLQVKIRGYRVELGEIETALAALPGVQCAVVTAPADPTGTRSLVAFLVPATSGSPPPDLAPAARRFLLARLPEYMVPARFVVRPDLPLTPSGKIDRPALLALAATTPEDSRDTPLPAHQQPRSDAERVLVDIWESILNRRPVGIHESFFELGGHSLAAVRLMYEVRQRLGWTLPLALLVEHPTLADLAAQFAPAPHAPSGAPQPGPAPIHGASAGPVLFFVPGIPGVNYLPNAFRQRVAATGRFCDALQFPGLTPGESPLDDVADLAREMIRRARDIDPDGPLALAGYSLGGVVAFEMARQLHAAGRAPRLVLLYDAMAPGALVPRSPARALLATARHLRDLGPREALRFVAQRWRGKRELLRARELGPLAVAPEATAPGDLARKALYDASFRAAGTLRRGPPYPGRVVLFRAREREVSFGVTRAILPDNGWSPFVGVGFVVEDVPGNHWQVLEGGNAGWLAERTAHWLAQG